MNDTSRKLLLAINRLPALRNVEKQRLVEKIKSLAEFAELNLEKLNSLCGRQLRPRDLDIRDIIRNAEHDLRSLRLHNIDMLTYADFPASLLKIDDPPFLLFVRGNPIGDISSPCVGLVGTRRPTANAIAVANEFGGRVADCRHTVVSGLAIGIDTVAMTAAVLHGGRVIAVIANGIDHIYPKENTGLAAQICEAGGSIVSEYAPGVSPQRFRFPARNRLISALSDATIIIEAPDNSGALITARYALQHKKSLYVHEQALRDNTTLFDDEQLNRDIKIIKEYQDIKWSGSRAQTAPLRRCIA